jgi:hypothetical protein
MAVNQQQVDCRRGEQSTVGPTMSGKSRLIVEIINNIKSMMSPPPDRIVYCYKRLQDLFSSIPGLELNEGLPDIDSFDPNKNNMVILDDLRRSATPVKL